MSTSEPVKVPAGRLLPNRVTGLGRGLARSLFVLCGSYAHRSPYHPSLDPLDQKGITGFLLERRTVLSGSCPWKCTVEGFIVMMSSSIFALEAFFPAVSPSAPPPPPVWLAAVRYGGDSM